MSIVAATSMEQVRTFVGDHKAVALDTENTSLDTKTARICGISLATSITNAMYIPTEHRGPGCLDLTDVLQNLREILEGRTLLIQNSKYDAEIILQNTIRLGLEPWDIWKTNKVQDTLLIAYMLGNFRALNEKYLVKEIFNYEMVELADLFGGRKKDIHVEELTVSKILDYAGDDSRFCYGLYGRLAPRLMNATSRELYHTEMELVKVVQKMERIGVKYQ
jgi:DNA polymerase-1